MPSQTRWTPKTGHSAPESFSRPSPRIRFIQRRPEAPTQKETPLIRQDPLKALLAPLLNDLDTPSRRVLELRYALDSSGRCQSSFPLTLEEIAAELSLSTTRERVRRIEKLALETLRKTAGATLLTALKQEAEGRREALTEKGEGQPKDLPNSFDLPWTDLAAAVCGVTTEEWMKTGNR